MLVERVGVGGRLPSVPLAELDGAEVRPVWAQQAFAGKKIVLVGAPAAFSPICSRLHVPGFLNSVPALRRSGFDQVVCVTPDNPWVLQAWSQQLGMGDGIRFLSDGNLKFGRALGLTTRVESLFLGECYERFVLIVSNCIVEKVSVETSVLEVSCTSAEFALAA